MPQRMQAADIIEMRKALKRCMIGGNHLALHIGIDHPLHTASIDDGLKHYGASRTFDIWCAWREIMQARDFISIKE